MISVRILKAALFGCALVLLPVLARAITLEAPERAARGDAFLALAESSAPVEAFVFQWLGKTHRALAAPVGPAGGATGRPSLWRAVILLPVPLDAGAAGESLSVRAEAGHGGAATQHVSFVDRDRPVQQLTVDRKYVVPPARQQARIKADRAKVSRVLAQYLPGRRWSLPFTRPVPDRGVSSLFGLRRVFNGQPRGLHRGLDLRAPQGEPVLACADGKVALTDNLYYSGNAVYVNHGEGVFTAYLHLSKILVKTGQAVKRGDVLGLVGATGRVTGPHLHLSLLVQGHGVDPQPFLDAQAGMEGR